jgi:exodeoxyribonuclease VII small subunit
MANKHKSDDPRKQDRVGDAPAQASGARPKFEDELADLEAIVGQIDSGELSLEESISAFERGVALVSSLNRTLNEVERRVEVLVRGAQGELKSTPYRGEGVPSDDNAADNGAEEDDDDAPF